jgi:hypothetical protein
MYALWSHRVNTAASHKMAFGGGDHPGANLDCCTTNPDNYKVIAETSGGRLVEMTLPPGACAAAASVNTRPCVCWSGT